MLGGARAHAIANASRVVIQIGTVSVLLPTWGLALYGEWLILAAISTYMAFSELGVFSAAAAEMTMSVARGERDRAAEVFRAVSRAVAVVAAAALILLPVLLALVPLASWLSLAELSETAAVALVMVLAVRAILIAYAGLLYGGFASVGRYGEGILVMSAITFAETVVLLAVAVAGAGPVAAAAAMLAVRLGGTIAMYLAMQRRAPWLRFGRPAEGMRSLRRLLSPGLASTAIGTGAAINFEGMLILIGAVLGPASAAVFATLRTLTRIAVQLLAAISGVVGPELARAYGAADRALLRGLHRRASQLAVWAGLGLLGLIALLGDRILELWTRGEIESGGTPLLLLLLAGAIETVWFTSGAILFWTNRHQRVAAVYAVASLASIPLAYALLEAWELSGVAAALIGMQLLLLVVVLPQALPAADDALPGWAATVATPPLWALAVARARLLRLRRS